MNQENQSKKKNNTIKWILDNLILTILLIFVIFAWYQGKFIEHEVHVVEVCQGTPKNPNQIINLQEQGIINLEPKGEDEWQITT